jgi:hypothetical protein
MIYRIVQYIQPWEIDDLERQIDQLIKSSYYIDSSSTVILDCTMNLDIVDWQRSKIAKEYFENKFNYIKNKASFYFKTEFDTDNTIRGAADKRRNCAEKKQDYTIWLDSDIFFSIQTLPYIQQATQNITDELYILTSEIIRYWDTSWDCITHAAYLTQPHNHRDFFDLYSLDNVVINNDISIKKLKIPKFGAGWFTLMSDQLIKQIKIPNELGSYGPDDTYIMICSQILQVPQYVLQGVVVTEIGNRYLEHKDYIKPLLDVKITDKQKITDETLYELIHQFNKNYDQF